MAGNSIKTTALYCRLSNADGDDAESNSISTQKAILTRYAKKQGFYKTKFFVDDGYTGTNFDRPGFKKMLKGIEAGEIGTVIVKDRSRLGRNFLETGKYTQIVFPEHGVKFIAVSNPTEGDPDDAYDIDVFLDIFNSWYPKDVSRKVKAVLRSKSKSGKPISVFAPYGYKKDPEDRTRWIIDTQTSPVVKRIFQLYMEGYGTTEIATILRRDKVLAPSEYRRYIEGTASGRKNHDPYGWSDREVCRILKEESYTGIVVNFKTKRVSFNSKKRVETSDQEREIIKNAHEAIIDVATFQTVQNLLKHRKRLVPLEEDLCPLTQLVYCADCGRIMYHARGRSERINDMFRCSGASMKYGCTGHTIRSDDLTVIVEQKIKAMLEYCLNNQEEFMEKVTTGSVEDEELRKELEGDERRLQMIEKIFMALYEDRVSGTIKEEDFIMMSGRYSEEQSTLQQRVKELKGRFRSVDDLNKAAIAFIAAAKKFQGFEKLTPEIARTLIAKVLVKEKEHPGTHERDVRPERVEIEWNFIGKFKS